MAKNEYRCVDTAYAIVKIFTGGSVNIPSAFSPNQDGLNDIFYVLGGAGINIVKNFIIFNRWGQKVFETNNRKSAWDGTFNGKLQPLDVYAYTLDVTFSDGKKFRKTGDITLLR